MAIITDEKKRTITLTQPVIEIGKVSNGCYRSTALRTREHSGELGSKVMITFWMMRKLEGRTKIKIGNHFWKIIRKERGFGAWTDKVRKPKKTVMGKVKHYVQNKHYQGYCGVQFNKIMRVGKYKP